jgi:hypothetical protein
MADIAALSMDIRDSPSALERGELGHRVESVDCYQLPKAGLNRFEVVIIPPMIDQEHLARHRALIRAYLDSGGVLIFGGQIHRDWLPGAGPFQAIDPPSLQAYRVTEIAEHPIFDGVDPDDLTFRRGVAGFFARGHHPVPDGAEVLVRLTGGLPVTYIDRVSTAGTILLHANGELLGYRGQDTAGRMPGQLIEWAVDEARHRRAAATSTPVPEDLVSDNGAVVPSAAVPGRGGLAAVYGGSAQHHRSLTMPKYSQHLSGGLVYLPDLADTDLTGYDGLLIPERLHRGLLTRAADRIHDLLNSGGTVITFTGGEPLPDFLPGVRWEHRPTNFWWWLEPGADLGLQSPTPDHSLFEHLSVGDCTWHHHGVLDAPAGAKVLVALPTGEALLYVDRVSTAGTLVVAALDPMSHFGSHFMPAAERFLNGFLPWAASAVLEEVQAAVRPPGRVRQEASS